MCATMKFMSFQTTLIGIVLAMAFQSSCSARPGTQSARADQSSDTQLLREVEQFASSGEGQSTSAWQSLQSHDRSKLIADLTRISNTLAPDDRNRVLIAFTFCKLGHEYAASRKIVLSALSRQPPFRNLFGDWAVSLVGRLMIQGDSELLVPLFAASEWSDGAMTTELVSAYSQAVAAQPENFLRLLSSQPEPTRSRVLKLLKYYSLSPEEHAKVKSYLNSVPRQSELRSIAEQTLRALTN